MGTCVLGLVSGVMTGIGRGSALHSRHEGAKVASTPDYASQILADVRGQIAVDDEILSETKARRNLVKRVARRFPGALKTFDSGSVAHGTVNRPVADEDC